jgi:hypothetical protein
LINWQPQFSSSHLEVEEQLDLTLAAIAKAPKHLDLERNPSFTQKVKWIRAFGPMGDDQALATALGSQQSAK